MRGKTVKVLTVAACFTLPIFGAELMARDHHRPHGPGHHHHRGGNTAVQIINAVGNLLAPVRTVVVQPAVQPVVVRPAVQPVVVQPAVRTVTPAYGYVTEVPVYYTPAVRPMHFRRCPPPPPPRRHHHVPPRHPHGRRDHRR